ncbi:putative metal transport system membrane protein|uniref:metal ABC transporter permease n=1 Tax=Neochlamydia sp. AcF84 TaxID=2315858 RepID=UPI00140C2515|nr:iron chelate uptake ABC transporter family permease subunit [Neochlamydia sp. AcF84]NGY94232.1 putative metal transport system membrane protein [Neochlamydia sp. AcF84]
MLFANSPYYYFTDAVLRAPTLGSMLMCLGASLVGVLVFLRKESLLGESLSHAAYPGVMIGVILAGMLHLDEDQEMVVAGLIMIAAGLTALAGLWAIHWLEKSLRVRSDSALCFILAAFFGIGLTLASQVQFSFSTLYRQAQVYLYGQAATMTDIHIFVYGTLASLITLTLILLYKEIQTILFNKDYAKSLGINVSGIEAIIFFLIVLAVVIGIRSVGVVLMSAMLISPAAAARQYTNRLPIMLVLAACFGLISGYLGNYLSIEVSNSLASLYPSARLALPTGPMIVLVSSFICLLSLLLAPERGVLLRVVRIAKFRHRCMCENLLKAIWRIQGGHPVSFEQIAKYQSASKLYLRFVLWRLVRNGWMVNAGKKAYQLTKEGNVWAAKIVRLHRLWEVYLVDYLGIGAEKVHLNAEEMEHVITPELEDKLIILLNDPKRDPHHQLIPAQINL